MEKEGLSRSLTFLTEEGLSINTLITDRRVQIRKYMRVTWPAIKHRLDGWHVGKGRLHLYKKTLCKSLIKVEGKGLSLGISFFRFHDQ